MVDQINKITANYIVEVKKEDKGNNTFVNLINQGDSLPKLIVHFIEGRIYSIEFAGSQFFELPDDQLYYVMEALLSGDYVIKKTWFKREKFIMVPFGSKKLLPERTNPFDFNSYHLPQSFSKKS